MATKTKAKVQRPQLPPTIYITREKDGDSSFLVAWETFNDIEHGETVGMYSCTGSGQKVTRHTLV